MAVSVACLGSNDSRAVSVAAIDAAPGPLRRTTPIPPRPGGVAIATIVSSVENMFGRGLGGSRAAPQSRSYFFEMITVFMNASPMLSDDIVGSSATVRCTSRRE